MMLPRIIPTIIENRNAIKFLKNAALLPIYLASSGNVMRPISTKEETSAPTCE